MQNARAFHAGRAGRWPRPGERRRGNVREISQLLRPSHRSTILASTTVSGWLADNFGERTGNHDRSIRPPFTGRLDNTIETQLFRIAQEALTNVARHANATEVRIELAHRKDRPVPDR